MSSVLSALPLPVVGAPLAGGPSTPALVAAVSAAGGLGFLGAGYKARDAVADEIAAVRRATDRPFGVNVFVPGGSPGVPAGLAAYAERLAETAAALDVELGEPRWEDDGWDAKLELLAADPVAVVSFTFGAPPAEAVARLRAAGSEVWVTVTEPAEADAAAAAGADVLVVQGVEAGGHRGSFDEAGEGGDLGLLALLELVAARTTLPLVATGGLMTGAALAAALAAGAAAGQLGTALLLCPEAGTSAAHRAALAAGDAPTRITRAFTGRRARGIANRFLVEHSDAAPTGYPQVHHLTAPLRVASRDRDDPEAMHLWAGQAYALAREAPAGELVRQLAADARAALAGAARGSD